MEGTKLKRVERSFELRGGEGLGERPKPELIGPVLTHLHDTLQDAVRMGFLRSSRASGRISSSLKAASEIRFIGHSSSKGGGTILRFEVAPFGEAAGEWFKQTMFWEEGPKPEQTAFELLAEAVTDVRKLRKESNRFDPGLLRRISSYRHMLKRGIDSIAVHKAISDDATLAEIDLQTVTAASDLSTATPAPRRVRVSGRLDVMGASQGVLKLDLKPGVSVSALWQGSLPVEELREFFNREVVLEGTGIFRPSGGVLRIDADAIALGGEQDALFRKIPEPLVIGETTARLRLRASEASVYARIFGSIPAEETDEEFAAAVEQLS